MKAAPFEYSRAADVDEACTLLAADDGARIIAGGQTLVPMMAMRLARPTRLIDINRIAGLSYIRAEDGGIAVGATTRQCVLERDALIAGQVPLLARAVPHIGHAA
ncbi:MAG: FAD binding domain-containing protein, partial [Stellaceae bacterium]